MELRSISWWMLVAVGAFISLFTIINGEIEPASGGYVYLLFGCMLMICGALLKARYELSMTEKRLFREILEFEEAMIKLGKIEKKQLEGISNWKLRDVDYRLKELEKQGK
jgi:hypothetical protein